MMLQIDNINYHFSKKNVVEIGIFIDGTVNFYGDFDSASQRIFDVASITKAVTAETAKKLIEKKIISLKDAVSSFIPELRVAQENNLTIQDLLEYRLNLDLRLSLLKDKSAQEIWRAILDADLKEPIGASTHFANSTSIILGVCLEQATGRKLDDVVAQELLKPLAMNDTTFFPLDRFKTEQLVPTEIDPWRHQEIRGEVHDESAWKMRPQVVGSAGLFSSVQDLVKLGRYALEKSDPLGWEINQAWMGEQRRPTTFGKTGFTGCSLLIDPERAVVIAIASNYTYPHRPRDRSSLLKFRQTIADEVFAQVW